MQQQRSFRRKSHNASSWESGEWRKGSKTWKCFFALCARRVQFSEFLFCRAIKNNSTPLHFIISRIGNSSCFEECSVDNYDFYAAAFHSFTNEEGEKENIPTRFAVNQVERLNIFLFRLSFPNVSTMFTGLTSEPQMLNCRNVIH